MECRNQPEKGYQMAAIPLPREPEIEYPDSDGKPMAESPIHLKVMLHCIEALQDHFAEEPNVYVSGNMLLYYEEGKRSSVAPDVFVVRGVPKDDERDVYLLWRERKAPCFVLEVTSKTTRGEDQVSRSGSRATYSPLLPRAWPLPVMSSGTRHSRWSW